MVEKIVWMNDKDSKNITEYLNNAYNRLETDFVDYLEYVPLKEDHLKVTSQRLADFIQRISALLSKSLRIVTLGSPMQQYCERSMEFRFGSGSLGLEKLYKHLNGIYNKVKVNKDTLNDYYILHDINETFITGFWNGKPISKQEIELREKIGVLEYPQTLVPFKHEEWYSWKDSRNAIEHRYETTTSMKNVLYGVAYLAIVLNNILEKSYVRRYAAIPLELKSKIFKIGKTEIRYI